MQKNYSITIRYGLRLLALLLLATGLCFLHGRVWKPKPMELVLPAPASMPQTEQPLKNAQAVHTASLYPTDGDRLMGTLWTHDPTIMKRLLDLGVNPNCPTWKDHYYVLVAAASSGNCETGYVLSSRFVKLLLDKGANPNVADSYDCTPLYYAAYVGDIRSVSHLLKHHARVDAPDFQKNTPLIEAAGNGQDKVVRLLLKHGARIDANNGAAMAMAADKGNLSTVKLLLQHGANLHLRDKHPTFCPLWNAIDKGDLPIVDYLIRHGANISSTSSDGNTALGIAEDSRLDQIVARLKKAGAKEPVHNYSAP